MKIYTVLTYLIYQNFHLFECKDECSKTICNPKAGDLLIGRESFLRASSTCGLSNIEKYCVVTPSDGTRKSKCNFCYSKDPYQKFSSSISHRIENVVSRLPQDPSRWWQSENGVHNVSIEISFESEFQFTFTHLRFKTYRPAAMYIERSKDYGRTWQKYAYFSENCARDFPQIPERKRNSINEVLCTSEFSSIIPSEGGTVLFSADTSDWHNEVFWNKERNDITAITNLRVQFVRLHTFGDWKIDSNPNIRNKYYYAVSEWIIRGRCSCYGHASKCKQKEGQIQIKEMVYGVCECEHNTKGQHCEKCADFYNDSPWLPADKNSTNACRKCDCNNHASSCYFNPMVYFHSGNQSGGVCDNCQHNTESKNCERCKSGYYRNVHVPINHVETCLKCQCNSQGTTFSQLCAQENEPDRNLIAGSCICKENVDGIFCDKCKNGFWKFDEKDEKGCTECKCVMMGTINNNGCDPLSGYCYCKSNVMKSDCSTCKEGYFNLSSSNPDGCTPCKCNQYGSFESQLCDKFSGQCNCKDGYMGKTCNEIKPGWYVVQPRYPLQYQKWIRVELPPVTKSAYYNFIITMNTQQMQIFDSTLIAVGISHDRVSSCQDFQNTMILNSESKYIIIPNKCLEKDIPISVTIYTIEKSSDKFSLPTILDIIVIPMLDINDTKTTSILDKCLKFKKGSHPKECNFLKTEISSKPVSKNEPKKCACNVTGSINNICDPYGGQCNCLPNVEGKNCDQCVRHSYGFDARGCKKCECDPNGSLNLQCSGDSGKCICRTGVEGQKCNTCKSGYWNYPHCDTCKCNQMADSCDQKTGQCINCRANSFGFNCHQCENGYYGDPSRGISCSKCDCPGVNNRNNSIGCSLIFNTTTYFCLCKPGYKGRFCDSCDANHFGNPLSQDGMCNKCNCSGNINIQIPESCDSKTGECKKCLYNTDGFNCEKCVSGYFGSGINRSCKKCVCNKIGTNFKSTENCNHQTGQCPCQPNVIGLQCDQCQDNYYNISSKVGCSFCNCDFPIGAKSKVCDKFTGQCQCHSGRSGLKCDSCEDGYWGDPRIPNGCQVCVCNPEGSLVQQCNRLNGACRCKAGITGRYCDHCMRGTDGKMPNCTSCGSCWKEWDGAIDKVKESLLIIHNDTSKVERIQYPAEINTIFDSIYNYLNLSKSMLVYFPPKFQDIVQKIESKFIKIKNMYDAMNLTKFDATKYPIEQVTNRINEAKQLVANNMIKDVEGANIEIKNSLHSISNSVLEINILLNKLDSTRKNLISHNEGLKNIDFELLNKKNEEFDNLLNVMLNNLKTFNGVTCNLQINDKLKCSESCGGANCLPDKCFRNENMDYQCMRINSTLFFNGFTRNIGQKSEIESNIKAIIDYLNMFASKNFGATSIKSEEDFNAIQKLIVLANHTIQTSYFNAKELLHRLKTFVNESVSESDFNALIEKIFKFDLSYNEQSMEKLGEEISKRKEKLTNVDSILEKSKENRLSCEILKNGALDAKRNATSFLNSIQNVAGNYKTMEFRNSKTDELLSNSNNNIRKDEEMLLKIATNQNKTKIKQEKLVASLDKIILIESKIKNNIVDFSGKLKNLTINQEQRLRRLDSIKDGINTANQIRKTLTQSRKSLENKLSQNVKKLIDKVQSLSDKIIERRERLAIAKQNLLEKQSKIRELGLEIDSKLNRLSNYEKRIYSKSEFHAKCLP